MKINRNPHDTMFVKVEILNFLVKKTEHKIYLWRNVVLCLWEIWLINLRKKNISNNKKCGASSISQRKKNNKIHVE